MVDQVGHHLHRSLAEELVIASVRFLELGNDPMDDTPSHVW